MSGDIGRFSKANAPFKRHKVIPGGVLVLPPEVLRDYYYMNRTDTDNDASASDESYDAFELPPVDYNVPDVAEVSANVPTDAIECDANNESQADVKDNRESEARKEIKLRTTKKHYTMSDARRIAREVNLEFRRRQQMAATGGGDGERPTTHVAFDIDWDRFASTKRTCWAKSCRTLDTVDCRCRHRFRPFRDRLIKNKRRNFDPSSAWKITLQENWSHLVERARSVCNAGFIWQNEIRNIEGHYGTSVAAVFVFIQWLFLVNVLVFVVVGMLIVMPKVLYWNEAFNISKASGHSTTHGGIGFVQDFVQGTGWMTWTEMFYGYYQFNHSSVDTNSGYDNAYNLPFAYILATMSYFGLCLILMLRNTAKGSRENLFTMKGRVNECCNIVFVGWDYCISKEKKAGLRHDIIYNEIKVIIEEDRLLELKKSRTEKDRIVLCLLRVLINIFVVCLLLLCGYLIYFVVYQSTKRIKESIDAGDDVMRLVFEFLPPIVITSLNIFVPFAFYRLVTYESYSPAFVINITLVRTVFLKMASFLVLVTTFYDVFNENQNGQKSTNAQCWETDLGQQIYKLAIMDFASGLFITFFVHFPRMLLVTRTAYTFTKFIGRQQFDIPNNVLDIVYSQTLCWMGTFYCPLLPVLNVIKCFVFFYVKKFSLFINCEPSRVTYRASKSNALFTIVLLLSFILAIVPVSYSIGEKKPSSACGPFMGLDSMWEVVPKTMKEWPTIPRNFLHYFGTAGFAIPIIILLLLIIYFYITMSAAHKHEIRLLQEQLLMEGRDKQYLLNRLRHVLAYRQSCIAAS